MTYGIINSDLMTTSDGVSSAGLYGFKNRLINGDMKIDQRNAGASVTGSASTNVFPVDRWFNTSTQNSKLTLQQNAGSVTPPVGFKNYVGATSSSAYSVLTADAFTLAHRIEGYNIADLAWGTASAATVTLSFWVRSSLTGTFGGCLSNTGGSRSYPFTYTINSANTWEQKSVTIAGDTTGTWATDNTIGISIYFGLGAGATLSGTAGTWAGATYLSATGATSVVGTSGATFYITGVQLEKGSTATSFDYRPYGTELALCQRYYTNTYASGTAPATATSVGAVCASFVVASMVSSSGTYFPVVMRSTPTISVWDTAGNANKCSIVATGATTFTANQSYVNAPFNLSPNGFIFTGYNLANNYTSYIQYASSAEL